jgi:hypothetical protein
MSNPKPPSGCFCQKLENYNVQSVTEHLMHLCSLDGRCMWQLAAATQQLCRHLPCVPFEHVFGIAQNASLYIAIASVCPTLNHIHRINTHDPAAIQVQPLDSPKHEGAVRQYAVSRYNMSPGVREIHVRQDQDHTQCVT